LSYNPSELTAYLGVAFSGAVPTVTGTGISFSVNPALPLGLAINAATGVISGAPTATSASATYTVTAVNSEGSTSVSVTIVVGPAFTVASTLNSGDSNPGDGICDNGSGACTLRSAIQEANAINLPAQITVGASTISTAGTEIPITTKLSLVGASTATTQISGANTSRIFNSTSSALSISKMTLTAGNAGATATSQGGRTKACEYWRQFITQ
jgi:hypothetical protein